MKKYLFSFFILCILLAAKSYAQTEQEYTIMGILVEGNESGAAETIIAQSQLRKGQTIVIQNDDIRKAISRIWQQNIFSDVDIILDKISPQSDGKTGIYLTIKVKELPRFDTVGFTGFNHVSPAEIQKLIPFYKGDFARPWEIDNVKRLIKNLYAKEGYQYATVEPVIEKLSNGKVSLIYTISEGEEIIVNSIQFTGNKKMSSDDLRSALSETSEKVWWNIFSSGKFDQNKYEDDKRGLIRFYRSKGFRDATILSDSLWVTNGDELHIIINVYEGNQYFIRNIGITGNEVLTEWEILYGIGLRKGDVYDVEKLELNLRGPSPDFSDVGSLYYDRGYMVNVTKDETIIGTDSIDVTVRVQEGKRFYFRNIDIAGNTKTKDFVIRRSLYTRPGDAFSRSSIIRSLRELSQLNYFNQEKLEPKVNFVPDATQVDVTFNVEERSSDTFNASIGYGGAQGLLGSLGVSFNNFDIADPLHGGAGQIFSISAEFGQSQYRTFSLSFQEPWLFQERTILGVTAYYQTSNYFYSQNRLGASLSVGRRLRWPDDYFSINTTIRGESTNITSGGGVYTVGKHDETSIQVVLTRNSTDDPLFPGQGSELTFLTRLAYLPINSPPPNEPANYFKNSLTMKFYTPLAQFGVSQKLVLATIVDFGQLGRVGSQPYITPSERFTMGGAGFASGFYTIPLRGYDDASIGIEKSPSGTFSEGGAAYSRYVAELRFQISREPIPLFVLAFAEAGNVWKDWGSADPFDLKRAVGVGARVQVPAVGLIGIDLGYGFDSPYAFGVKSGWLTHFQFGKFF
jgi:outer membrane protein insertion porin family